VWHEYVKTHLKSTSSSKSQSSGMFPITKARLDAYYAPHNTRLRNLLEKYGSLSKEFPFPSTWPVLDERENSNNATGGAGEGGLKTKR
jgi:hypothetical protein